MNQELPSFEKSVDPEFSPSRLSVHFLMCSDNAVDANPFACL